MAIFSSSHRIIGHSTMLASGMNHAPTAHPGDQVRPYGWWRFTARVNWNAQIDQQHEHRDREEELERRERRTEVLAIDPTLRFVEVGPDRRVVEVLGRDPHDHDDDRRDHEQPGRDPQQRLQPRRERAARRSRAGRRGRVPSRWCVRDAGAGRRRRWRWRGRRSRRAPTRATTRPVARQEPSGSGRVAVPQFGQNRSWPASVVPHCVQKPAIAPPLPMNGQADDSVSSR